jgi:glycosyltransferase involved in cell wall biosynthesis
MSSYPFFSIITPTWRQQEKVLMRCIKSVGWQECKDWEQLIIADCSADQIELHVTDRVRQLEEIPEALRDQVKFVHATKEHNDCGASPRNIGVGLATGMFMIFLDDDNIILPDHLSLMRRHIVSQSQTRDTPKIYISNVVHFGPLPKRHGPAPVVLRGDPPKVGDIDTLQLCVESQLMKEYEWKTGPDPYYSDGYNAERLCKSNPYYHVQQPTDKTFTAMHL